MLPLCVAAQRRNLPLAFAYQFILATCLFSIPAGNPLLIRGVILSAPRSESPYWSFRSSSGLQPAVLAATRIRGFSLVAQRRGAVEGPRASRSHHNRPIRSATNPESAPTNPEPPTNNLQPVTGNLPLLQAAASLHRVRDQAKVRQPIHKAL